MYMRMYYRNLCTATDVANKSLAAGLPEHGIHVGVCIYIYIYMYIYVQREREREIV